MTDILQAARSYYGLADKESCTTQLFTNQAGQACVAFEIPLSPADFLAIGERMKAMQEAESQQEEIENHGLKLAMQMDASSRLDMRAAYEALSPIEKGKYGSFGRYVAAASIEDDMQAYQAEQGIGGRKVAHVDAPEEPEPVSMDAVWLDAKDCSQAQMMHASDADLRSGRHLVQWAMLTDEQKQKAKEKL